jgi:uncharacterized membrane protein YfcA
MNTLLYEPNSLLIALIIFLSFTIQATFGFAGGLIALPLLNFIVDSKDAINIIMIFQFLMSGLIYSVRKDIEWKKILTLFPFLFIGLSVGLLSNIFFPNNTLRIMIGIYLILYSLTYLFKKNRTDEIKSTYIKYIVSIFTGYVQGAIGTGGPVIIPFLKKISSSSLSFRANLILIFSVLNATRLLLTLSDNKMGSFVLTQATLALPFFIVALIIGSKMAKRSMNNYIEKIIMLFLLASGLVLLF